MRRGISFALVLVGVTAASPARADFNLSMGLKWIPTSYTKPVSATSGTNGPAPTPLTGWQTTSLDNNLGLFFLDGRLGFQIGLDLGYGSANVSATGANSDMSYTQFGFSLGAKYYITQPKAAHVSPYVLLDFFKYFASISTSDKSVSNDQAGYVAGLASPLGIDAAFGAEYFFTSSFSLGAEVIGLKYAYSEGDYALTSGFGGTTVTAKNQYLTIYTGISLNYRFAISGSVHLKEEGAEETPSRPVRKVTPQNRSRGNDEPPAKAAPAPANEEPPPENPEEVD